MPRLREIHHLFGCGTTGRTPFRIPSHSISAAIFRHAVVYAVPVWAVGAGHAHVPRLPVEGPSIGFQRANDRARN